MAVNTTINDRRIATKRTCFFPTRIINPSLCENQCGYINSLRPYISQNARAPCRTFDWGRIHPATRIHRTAPRQSTSSYLRHLCPCLSSPKHLHNNHFIIISVCIAVTLATCLPKGITGVTGSSGPDGSVVR